MSGLWAFLIVFALSALAEMGGKHQFLMLGLAKRYRPYWALLGMFVAQIVNLLLAVVLGQTLAVLLPNEPLIPLIAAVSLTVIGLWVMKRDMPEDLQIRYDRVGPVFTSAAACFLVQLGGKTQLAVIALAALFPAETGYVVAGCLLGPLIANALVILFGLLLSRKIPYALFRLIAGGCFFLCGMVKGVQVLHHRFYCAPWQSALLLGCLTAGFLTGGVLIIKKNQS